RTGLPPASATAVSDATGAFTVRNLPAGDYRFCVQVASGNYLDPCHWSAPQAAPASALTLIAGQAVAGTRIALQPAAHMQVRINDPHKLLAPGNNVLIGVLTSSGRFRHALVKSSDAAGQNHEISIPFDTPVRLSVYISTLT